MIKNYFHLKYYFVIIILFIISCANQLPPGGGAEDKIPPKIIFSEPVNGTVNFSKKKLTFEFDEYVERRSFQESIFISPFFEDELGIEWSGREVEINFPSELKANQTYVLSISGDVQDMRNNRMDKPFTLVFSTGDKIDSGIIKGRIFSDKITNIAILLYDLNKHNNLDISKDKPDYINFPSKNGDFTFIGLAKSKYKAIAIKDEFRNYLYDMDQDLIGFPHKDIEITDSIHSIANINIELINEDTIKPKLVSLKQIDNDKLQLNFNKSIDSSTIKIENIKISDKYGNDLKIIKDLYRGELTQTSIYLAIDQTPVDTNYILKISNYTDLLGNSSTIDTMIFSMSDIRDTIAPKIVFTDPVQKSASVDNLLKEIIIKFDEYFIKDKNISESITLQDTLKNIIPLELNYIDGATLKLTPKTSLKQKMNYKLDLKLNKFNDLSGNKVDSVFKLEFKTIDNNYYGEISGIITNKTEKDTNLIIELKDLNKKYNYKKIIKKEANNNFKFERLNEGNYYLKVFNDLNSDSIYTNGSSIYKKLGEPFFITQDTIKIKARWPIKDFQIDLKNLPR